MQQSLSDMSTCAATWHHTPCAMMQYNPAPGSHGSVKFLYARIADIFMGTIITSLFTLVLPWSVLAPHHSLHSVPTLAFSSNPHLPSTVVFSSPPSCLQHSLLLPSALPFLAFSTPFFGLQQSSHLPSAIPLLPAAVPALVFSNPHYLQTSICLQQSLYLPSQSLHMPSTVPPLAYTSPSTCLQQPLARGPCAHAASCKCMSHVNVLHIGLL